MMTGRHGERLPEWLAAADLDDLPHLHSFIRGIRRDQATSVIHVVDACRRPAFSHGGPVTRVEEAAKTAGGGGNCLGVGEGLLGEDGQQRMRCLDQGVSTTGR